MYTVVFVEPESSGNIGALARVMKNFGLSDLVIVHPRCRIDNDAKTRAKHAFDIIDRARVVKSFSNIGKFDFIIGTTGKTAPNYDEVRCCITPRELVGQIKTRGNLALVFGREGTGLSNEELKACDIIVCIPTDRKYPVMNVTHAAAVLFYELFSNRQELVRRAELREKEVLFDYFGSIVERLSGLRDKKKVVKIFKNLINRSMIAGKEAHTLAGVLKEIDKKI